MSQRKRALSWVLPSGVLVLVAVVVALGLCLLSPSQRLQGEWTGTTIAANGARSDPGLEIRMQVNGPFVGDPGAVVYSWSYTEGPDDFISGVFDLPAMGVGTPQSIQVEWRDFYRRLDGNNFTLSEDPEVAKQTGAYFTKLRYDADSDTLTAESVGATADGITRIEFSRSR